MTTKHKQVLNLIDTAFLASGLAGCGKEVYELGQRTVSANKEKVIELGPQAYGLSCHTLKGGMTV